MYWNNRIWKQTHWAFGEPSETLYSVRETYYNDKGEICATTEEPARVHGESVEQLVESLRRMLKIAESSDEILNYNTFVFSSFGGNDD